MTILTSKTYYVKQDASLSSSLVIAARDYPLSIGVHFETLPSGEHTDFSCLT
jgi:hypothetical protein